MKARIMIVILVLATPVMAQTDGWHNGVTPTSSGTLPRSIPYQGYLTNTGNAPVHGQVTVTFGLYTVPTGGSPLWSESQTVSASNGLFSAMLGESNPLTLPFDAQYYLGIRIGSDAELPQRVILGAGAYAFRSRYADEAHNAENAQQAATAHTAGSLAAGATGAVTSINALQQDVTLEAGANVTITPSGNTLRISAAAGGTGIQGLQNTNNTIDIQDPNGPTATINVMREGITAVELANNAVTGTKIADGAVTPEKINTSGAAAGQVLSFNGTNAAWMTTTGPTGLGAIDLVTKWTGPSSLGKSMISDNGQRIAIGANASSGAGRLHVENSNAATTLYLKNTNSAAGTALLSANNATWEPFRVTNDGATRIVGATGVTIPILDADQDGDGNAARIHVDNTSSNSDALHAKTLSTQITSDAIMAEAVAGGAVVALNQSATRPTILASNTAASGTAIIAEANINDAVPLLKLKKTNSSGKGNMIICETAASGTVFDVDWTGSISGNDLNLDGNVMAAGRIWADGYIHSASSITTSGTVTGDAVIATTELGSSNTPPTGAMYADNIVYAWAYVTSNGTASSSFGCTVQKNATATGQYDITFKKSLPGGALTVTPVVGSTSGSWPRVAGVADRSNTSCRVRTWRYNMNTNTMEDYDTAFYFQIVGRP